MFELSNTNLPWSPDQEAKRKQIKFAPSVIRCQSYGRNISILKVRLFILGKNRNIAFFKATQRDIAARVADMATLFFWEYRRRSAELTDSEFNYSLASARADLENKNNDAALTGVLNRFHAIIKFHKIERPEPREKAVETKRRFRIIEQAVESNRCRTIDHDELFKKLNEALEALDARVRTIELRQATQHNPMPQIEKLEADAALNTQLLQHCRNATQDFLTTAKHFETLFETINTRLNILETKQ